MNLFEILHRLSEDYRLPFVVIGGHAVNALGYSRQTLDLDLMVRRADRDAWLAALAGIGYGLDRDGEVFLQLAPGLRGMWPIDLMLANERTFDGVFAESTTREFRGASLRVPSLEHLFALKLHALKHGLPHRDAKDFGDLTQLILANTVDVRGQKFRQLVEKYGTTQIYERLLQTAGPGPTGPQ